MLEIISSWLSYSIYHSHIKLEKMKNKQPDEY